MRSELFKGMLAASVLVFSVANAEPKNWRSVDVTPLDIAGVKLGMSYEEALAAISHNFQLSPGEIKRIKASTLYVYSRIAKSQQVNSIRFMKDGTTLAVSFSVQIPLNQSSPVAVSGVHYGIPNTKENVAMLKEESLSKYGQPSDSRRQATMMWCAHYNKVSQCELSKPRLTLTLGSLVLKDPTLDEAAREYEQGLLKTKPNI